MSERAMSQRAMSERVMSRTLETTALLTVGDPAACVERLCEHFATAHGVSVTRIKTDGAMTRAVWFREGLLRLQADGTALRLSVSAADATGQAIVCRMAEGHVRRLKLMPAPVVAWS